MFKTETKTVTVDTSAYIRDYRDVEKFLGYCKQCHNYDSCWSCPPHDFDVESYLDEYPSGVLIATKIMLDEEMRKRPKTKEEREAFIEGLILDYRQILDDMLLAMEKTIPGSKAFFAGSCHFCDTCAKREGKPCRHDDKRRVSLEAIGFDMAKTTEELFEIEMLWSKDELPPYFTLVSGLFLKS